MQTATERVIDRNPEFDQTAISQPDGHGEPVAADYARPMPDVTTRQNLATPHNRTPSIDLVRVTAERDDLQMRLDTAMLRIQGFEKLVQNFAEKFDEMNADCIFLTGRSFDEYLSGLNRERAQREHSIGGICRSPSPASPGLVCLRDKGHEGPCSTNPQPPPVAKFDITVQCNYRRLQAFGPQRCQLIHGHSGEHVY